MAERGGYEGGQGGSGSGHGDTNLGENGKGIGRSPVLQSDISRLEANSKTLRRVHLASGLVPEKIITAASSKAYRF